MVRVKVCCIRSLEEAEIALGHGASALGLVSAMPSGPGTIDDGTIAAIAAAVPPGTDTFLLTAERAAEAIAAQHGRMRVHTIQLVDRVDASVYAELRARLPDVTLVQVVHVRGPEAIEEAARAAAGVDAILLDSGDPTLRVRELGGTGRTHDWTVSRDIVDTVDRPVWLAGGLGPRNVDRAIESVRPYGVDLCSGVRTAGALDRRKLARFMDVVGRAA